MVVGHLCGHLKTQAPSSLLVHPLLSPTVGSIHLADGERPGMEVLHISVAQISLVRTQSSDYSQGKGGWETYCSCMSSRKRKKVLVSTTFGSSRLRTRFYVLSCLVESIGYCFQYHFLLICFQIFFINLVILNSLYLLYHFFFAKEWEMNKLSKL